MPTAIYRVIDNISCRERERDEDETFIINLHNSGLLLLMAKLKPAVKLHSDIAYIKMSI